LRRDLLLLLLAVRLMKHVACADTSECILNDVLQTRLHQDLDSDESDCRNNASSSSPFFVYSRRQILSNVEAYNSALATTNLPYLIGYSVKVANIILSSQIHCYILSRHTHRYFWTRNVYLSSAVRESYSVNCRT